MKDYPVMSRDAEGRLSIERAYYAVPCNKDISRMPAKEQKEYLSLVCSRCGGKILPTHKYVRTPVLSHLNCPPDPIMPTP